MIRFKKQPIQEQVKPKKMLIRQRGSVVVKLWNATGISTKSVYSTSVFEDLKKSH